MERLMRAHGQQTVFASDRILQLNPHHPVIAKMAQMEDPTDYILVLFNQTLVIEGEPIKDPALWTEKLMALLLK
jgi:HSP90 family molecular chaperone